MKANFNLWVENNGSVVMSIWRANFLQAIAASHSLKAAAEKMDISTAGAQQKLQEMETGLGYKLVSYVPGDKEQDHLHLTPDGERLLKNFEEFASGFDEEVSNKFKEKFK